MKKSRSPMSDYFTNASLKQMFLAYPILSLPGTYAAIIFQFLFVFFIWNSRFRKALLIVGTIFHAMIATTMNLHFFGLTMIFCYSVFFTDSEVRKIQTYIFPKYDEVSVGLDLNCSWCRFFARFLDAFKSHRITKLIVTDINHLHSTEDHDRGLRQRASSMSVLCKKDHHETTFMGFDAVSILMRLSLVSLFVAIPIYFFEKTKLGNKVYAFISLHRPCDEFSCLQN